MKVLFAQSCLTLCDPVDCSPPGSSVHGILQAGILERVAIPFSRGSSQPRDQTEVSCIAGRYFTTDSPGKPNGDKDKTGSNKYVQSQKSEEVTMDKAAVGVPSLPFS